MFQNGNRSVKNGRADNPQSRHEDMHEHPLVSLVT